MWNTFRVYSRFVRKYVLLVEVCTQQVGTHARIPIPIPIPTILEYNTIIANSVYNIIYH